METQPELNRMEDIFARKRVPRERLSPKEHADRAIGRFIGPLAEDINNAPFAGGTYSGKEYSGEDVRKEVQSLLFRLNPQIAPETANFLVSLEGQHRAFLDTLIHYGFLDENGNAREGDARPPSFEAVRNSFTLKQAEAARKFESPTLLLIPDEVSFEDLIKALNAHKALDGQIDANVDNKFLDQNSGSNITGYCAVIVEGAQNMPIQQEDLPNDTWGNRVEARKKRNQAKNVRGMDRNKAALLMMHSYAARKPVDNQFLTLLDDDPALSTAVVPYASLYLWPGGCRPCFGVIGSGYVAGRGRFRSSVGGEEM